MNTSAISDSCLLVMSENLIFDLILYRCRPPGHLAVFDLYDLKSDNKPIRSYVLSDKEAAVAYEEEHTMYCCMKLNPF